MEPHLLAGCYIRLHSLSFLSVHEHGVHPGTLAVARVARLGKGGFLQSSAAIQFGGLQQLASILLSYSSSLSPHRCNCPHYKVSWDQPASYMSIGYSCQKAQIRANNHAYGISQSQIVYFTSQARSGCTRKRSPPPFPTGATQPLCSLWGRLCAHWQVGQPLHHAQHQQSPSTLQSVFQTHALLPAWTATRGWWTTWKLLSKDIVDLSFIVCHLFNSGCSTFLCCVWLFLEYDAVLKYGIKCFNEIWIDFFSLNQWDN